MTKILFTGLLMLVMGLNLHAKDVKKETAKTAKSATPIVVLETNVGKIELKLYPKVAPKAVENFVTHVKNGYYNGLIFHRVIKDFIE